MLSILWILIYFIFTIMSVPILSFYHGWESWSLHLRVGVGCQHRSVCLESSCALQPPWLSNIATQEQRDRETELMPAGDFRPGFEGKDHSGQSVRIQILSPTSFSVFQSWPICIVSFPRAQITHISSISLNSLPVRDSQNVVCRPQWVPETLSVCEAKTIFENWDIIAI